MRFLLYFILLIAPLTSIHAQQSPVEQLKKVLATQSAAWNEGNLETFMQPYWKSDSLMFITKDGVTYGWQATLDRYKADYPGNAAMGKLSFDFKEFKPLGKDLYLVVGKWHLERTVGNLEGHFSVLFRRIKGEWKIIADHSS